MRDLLLTLVERITLSFILQPLELLLHSTEMLLVEVLSVETTRMLLRAIHFTSITILQILLVQLLIILSTGVMGQPMITLLMTLLMVVLILLLEDWSIVGKRNK